jgi:hypothetical protein
MKCDADAFEEALNFNKFNLSLKLVKFDVPKLHETKC